MIRYLNLVVLVLAYGCIENSTKKDNIINRRNDKKILEHKKKLKDFNKNIFTKYTNDNFLISLQYQDSCICIENNFLFEIYNSQYKNDMTYFEFYNAIESNRIKVNWKEYGVHRIYAKSTKFDKMNIDEVIANYLTPSGKSRFDLLNIELSDEEECNLIKKMSNNFYYTKQSDNSGILYFNKIITYPPRAPLKRW
ncbi:MAG: hypothetical protein Q8K70_10045 [Bacteroidota bacterium]|nr:hypothetical protein [Bacteroidota bacterium]